MSFAVSGALANRGLTTIRLARVSGIAHLSLPVNRSGSTKLGKWKTHFLIRYDVFDEEQRKLPFFKLWHILLPCQLLNIFFEQDFQRALTSKNRLRYSRVSGGEHRPREALLCN